MSPTLRLTALLLTLGCAAAAPAAAEEATLRQTIEAADQALFGAVFDSCDAQAVGSMVTEDFEFFHDKWGQIAKSRADFVRAIGGACERQRQGSDFKARRELLRASSVVRPIKNYGALQTGAHAFFKLEPGRPPVPTEHARFTHLWRFESGRWLLARVISYDHTDGPADDAAAAARP